MEKHRATTIIACDIMFDKWYFDKNTSTYVLYIYYNTLLWPINF